MMCTNPLPSLSREIERIRIASSLTPETMGPIVLVCCDRNIAVTIGGIVAQKQRITSTDAGTPEAKVSAPEGSPSLEMVWDAGWLTSAPRLPFFWAFSYC